MRIFTHSGIFHADEVLAIATYNYFNNTKSSVTRGFEIPQDFSGYVLDIGREYNEKEWRFDHHQNPELPATNVLMLKHIVGEGEVFDLMCKYLYTQVSDIDRGLIPGGGGPGSLNSIINSFNNIEDGFKTAIDVCEKIVEGCYTRAKLAIEAKQNWELVTKSGKVGVNLTGAYLPNWKENTDGICYLVEPNPRGGYQVTSVSSDTHPIPVTDTQTFRHNSGFMAVYPDLQTAIEHASSL